MQGDSAMIALSLCVAGDKEKNLKTALLLFVKTDAVRVDVFKIGVSK
jgi:hypothetical protein